MLVFIGILLIAINAQLSVAQQSSGDIWVVLVAGSNEYYNYRHQADVYHAYQVVRNHGIPESNIVVFHYDDIANNTENPTKGIVINKPGGSDVYHGVPKDYTGEDVTPKNFLAAIQGDSELAAKGKKVVNSGPNDHIFIYFTDHGAPDLIAFPSEYLYGEDLNKALENMHKNKRYAKLVFYLEACESGSMFNTLLPKNINIYATTAANPTESSYACYYDSLRETYLGDLYSVNWIENSDVKSLGNETLEQQFKVVKQETNLSHVQEYGDLSMASLTLTQFQGAKESEKIADNIKVIDFPVDSGDVPLEIAKRKIDSAATAEQLYNRIEEYTALVYGRKFLIEHLTNYLQSIKHFVGHDTNVLLEEKREVVNRSCYRQLVDTFHQQCLNLNKHSYALRKLHVFVNVCERLAETNGLDNLSHIVNQLRSYCDENTVYEHQSRII